MRKQRFQEDKLVAEINIVPYVDVMLVLLVIFMITAPLLTQGVQVELPQAQAKVIDKQPLEPMIVTVDKVGNYYLNIQENPSKPIMPDALALRIAAELARTPNRQTMVRGDDQVSYGQVVNAMVLLQSAGVPSVGLVTSPIDEPG